MKAVVREWPAAAVLLNMMSFPNILAIGKVRALLKLNGGMSLVLKATANIRLSCCFLIQPLYQIEIFC